MKNHFKNRELTEDYINIAKESRLEKVKVKLEKVNRLLKPIPTDMTELNEFIYLEAKLDGNKIDFPQGNPK